jgi:hypothetical protein
MSGLRRLANQSRAAYILVWRRTFYASYIVMDCKIQGCRTVHILMHHGEKGKTPPKVAYWMSYPLMIDCPTCGKTYDYSDAEEAFWQKELPPPPAEYSNRLAGLSLRIDSSFEVE